ncbi:winged helix-turn-helix domain-containing protein [Streptomyces sp. S.PNR 29]|uniref:ArsR/SmtB family transcription factor n=1 Tax=Streptomyces sp. S.PNR 29 TaxID=2973805 RepID=UPI0025B11D8C|nr:winged helix-turn-helix domain-containing protein [Streptomyces sp. S.PNR 29]MDN0199268.1 winged helix-turn-helix domain-containing protein [Streptomyces sp. S.PNR 29]
MVDLFTLVGTVPRTVDAIDTLLRGPQRLRAELALYSPQRQALLPKWVFGAADGDGLAARRLAAALDAVYQATVAPHWPRIHAVLQAERAAAASVMITGGVDAMLGSLHPAIRWEPPVLEVPYRTWVNSDNIHLAGRGLVVTPSVFCRQPLLYAPEHGELMLIYPVVRDVLAAAEIFGTSMRDEAVAHLLGRTRAVVLEATEAGATTGQIARSLGISPASASQHAAVLREAGLVSSRRHGKTVCHSLTALGKALLDGTS